MFGGIVLCVYAHPLLCCFLTLERLVFTMYTKFMAVSWYNKIPGWSIGRIMHPTNIDTKAQSSFNDEAQLMPTIGTFILTCLGLLERQDTLQVWNNPLIIPNDILLISLHIKGP